MHSEKLLSIIIPCYNVECYVSDCFRSICNVIPEEIVTEVEIIIVNDGSTDSTGQIITEFDWGILSDNVLVVDKKNGGLSEARNEGLKRANGRYVAFLDSDDIWLPAMRAVLLKLNSVESDIVEFNSIRFKKTDDIRTSRTIFPYLCDTEHDENLTEYKALVFEYGIWMVWARFFKREIIGEMMFPVGKTFEDIMFTSLLYEQALSILTINKVCIGYRINPTSITAQTKPIDIISMGWVVEHSKNHFILNANKCNYLRLINTYLFYKTLLVSTEAALIDNYIVAQEVEMLIFNSPYFKDVAWSTKFKLKYWRVYCVIRCMAKKIIKLQR